MRLGSWAAGCLLRHFGEFERERVTIIDNTAEAFLNRLRREGSCRIQMSAPPFGSIYHPASAQAASLLRHFTQSAVCPTAH